MATREAPGFDREARLIALGQGPVAGVDEVGRGPLAGPVMAAAVILDPGAIPEGLDDSKRLSRGRRETLDRAIRESARIGLGQASVEEVDLLNVHHASLLAMSRAVAALPLRPGHVIVDGPHLPQDLRPLSVAWANPGIKATALIGGDRLSASVAAASIVAKVWRDRVMAEAAQHHPGFGWETNAGYGTKSHIAALHRLGPTPFHRRTFRPASQMLWQGPIVAAPEK